jgi:hypothetical protein
MLSLDTSTAENQLELAPRRGKPQASADAARATTTLARQQYDRVVAPRFGLVSQGEMDQAKSTQAQRRRLEAAEAQLERALGRTSRADEMRTSRCARLRRVVTQRFVEVGEPVIGSRPLMDADHLYVEAPLDG